ncbi:MAG TPA: hypothetical protein VJ576_09700 [Rhodocyclaceae bacterium]|nr:hypothetical protein [Rhodocyclaceae bacterium]
MTYANQKGRVTAIHSPATAGRRPPRQLSEAEQAAVAGNREFVLEHMPDAVPFIKELHDLGMIDGWRSVDNCQILATKDGSAA